jgi:hypothetical protein
MMCGLDEQQLIHLADMAEEACMLIDTGC